MTETSPKLGLPYIQPAQAQKHVTHNEAIRELDTLVQLRILEFGAETAPGTPALGQTHALGPVPGGAWAGQGGNLATWDGETWQFLTPQEGWLAWDIAASRLRSHVGGSWVYPDLTGDQLARLGIATAADDTNRLAVASEAVVFTHAGGDHRLKVNKATDPDTASLLFQSNWTGHAEMGLAGDTGFSLKVSADGSSWTQVMRAAPGALRVDVPITGAAVQSSATDTTAGRLMAVGAFGLGTTSPPVLSDVDDTSTVAGLYTISAPASGTVPFNYGFMQVSRRQANAVHQRFTSTSTPNRTYERYYNGSMWGAWYEIYRQDTILGTVSQSGGVPAGALIERGSNANGEYVRHADGTQLCTVSKSTSGSMTTNWIFPVAFISAPRVLVEPNSGSARFGNHHSTTSTSVNFDSWDVTGARSIQSCDLIAIGRWF